jgi:ABC-type glutathione transport system ATPase component
MARISRTPTRRSQPPQAQAVEGPSPDELTADGLAVFASGVTRTFGAREVLRGLDISIVPDEFIALLGRSGTGKSTLLRILGGLDPDYGGDVLVPQRRAVVFQEPRLIPWQRVLPNVALGLKSGPDGRSALRQQGLEALAEVGLVGQARAWPVADRALVLVDGRITLDLPVSLARPRDRGHPGFIALRSRLLAELGVTEPSVARTSAQP